MKRYILSIDQGTTSSRAILFNHLAEVVGIAQQEFTQIFPESGWVEHNPDEIWSTTLKVCRQVIDSHAGSADEIACIGITNQRETTIVWDRSSGKPVANAIVWQDRRTAQYCSELKRQGFEALVQQKTGLLLDPYFSATKLRWILQSSPELLEQAKAGQLAFGTVDSFLLWRLTGGHSHMTDITNASRTMLYNIHDKCWDTELLELFEIPSSILPEVMPCDAQFGATDASLLGRKIPITGMIGDQQSATVGQACFKPGMTKSTFGTGCFALMNTGESAYQSSNRLLTTVAYELQGVTHYAIEGSIFMSGAIVQWLRDKLCLIVHASETEALAQSVSDTDGVVFIPAFTGLGAPYWQPEVRASITGMSRDTSKAHIVRAALDAICFQTRDLVDAMKKDASTKGLGLQLRLRVDGGMTANTWLMQRLADLLDVTIDVPKVTETTAMGAAFAAGLGAGIFSSLEEIENFWQQQLAFDASLDESTRQATYRVWQESIAKLIG